MCPCQETSASAARIYGRKFRLIALFVCALYISVTFLSAEYILTHTEHIHDHEGSGGMCAACLQLTATNNLFKTIAAAMAAAAVLETAAALVLPICPYHQTIEGFSLVTLKVRMNN
ncbi:MAG: hypothetical protein LBB94_06415 [Clostridiales bacterium]|jgi:Na+/proline symporter|nr:hypothetical protein [Clostridiales bacterium]